MGTRFQKARFHVDFGPKALFERIYFKMDAVNKISVEGAHVRSRLEERPVPSIVLERLAHFSTADWELKTCEVRTDTGKFVNSTWETMNGLMHYWVTIGFGNIAETIVPKTSSGLTGIVREGPLFDFVSAVNQRLMAQEETQTNR